MDQEQLQGKTLLERVFCCVHTVGRKEETFRQISFKQPYTPSKNAREPYGAVPAASHYQAACAHGCSNTTTRVGLPLRFQVWMTYFYPYFTW